MVPIYITYFFLYFLCPKSLVSFIEHVVISLEIEAVNAVSSTGFVLP